MRERATSPVATAAPVNGSREAQVLIIPGRPPSAFPDRSRDIPSLALRFGAIAISPPTPSVQPTRPAIIFGLAVRGGSAGGLSAWLNVAFICAPP